MKGYDQWKTEGALLVCRDCGQQYREAYGCDCHEVREGEECRGCDPQEPEQCEHCGVET